MGNLESAEGGPGEPPSVSLLPPPGKMPMPEPCELEERFAVVLVRADPVPSPSYRSPQPPRPDLSAPGGTLPGFLGPAHPFSKGPRWPSTTSAFSGAEQPRLGPPERTLYLWTLRRRGP